MTTKRLWFRYLFAILTCVAYFVWISTQVDDPAAIETNPAVRSPEAIKDSPNSPQLEESKSDSTDKFPTQYSISDELVGQIVDSDGAGLSGITVRLRTLRRSNRGFFVRQALTDSTGVFVLQELDPNGVYMLSTEAMTDYPGYRLEGFTLDSLTNPFKITLLPLRLIEISGTVVDADHAPVANFTLTIDNLDHNYPSQTITSDASGYFRLESFPAGNLKIYTASSDYYRILGLQAKTDDYRNLTLVIDHGHYKLEGQILDPKGQPLEATRITLTSEISSNEYLSQAFRTRYTDATGRFEFSGLSGITQTLGVYATGYKPYIENHSFQKFSDQLEIQLLP